MILTNQMAAITFCLWVASGALPASTWEHPRSLFSHAPSTLSSLSRSAAPAHRQQSR